MHNFRGNVNPVIIITGLPEALSELRFNIYNPKYFSKNLDNFSMIVCFLACLFLPASPNKPIGGSNLSKSVPDVLITPSLNELSMNFFVSSGFRFSSSMMFVKSASFCSVTNFFQSSSTLDCVLIVVMKFSISSFLLLSCGDEHIALLMSASISLSVQFDLVVIF